MTTIVYKDGIFAWDSLIVSGNFKSYIDDKVFQNGSLIVGTAGYSRVGNVLKYSDLPQPDLRTDKEEERWLNRILIPFMRQELINAGYENKDAVISNSRIIVKVKNECFELDSSFHSQRVSEAAIGSGSIIASTALFLGKNAYESVQIAIALDNRSGGKIHELDTNKLKTRAYESSN